MACLQDFEKDQGGLVKAVRMSCSTVKCACDDTGFVGLRPATQSANRDRLTGTSGDRPRPSPVGAQEIRP